MMSSLFSRLNAGILIFLCGLFIPGTGSAEVNVNISIPLPGLVIPAPPGLIVIPGTYVYYSPDVDVDIFFFRGRWYRPYRGGWYSAQHYNGPWRGIKRAPRALADVPHGYRRAPARHARMPYGQVEKNWRNWEQERRWDRHEKDDRDRHGKEGKGHGKRKHGRD